MAVRRPLVLAAGVVREIPAGDTVPDDVHGLVAPRVASVTTAYSADGTIAGDIQLTATGNPTITPTGTPNGRMMIVEVLASGAQRTPVLATAVALTTGITTRSLVVPQNMIGVLGLRYSALAGTWLCLAASVESP